jgi:hypothetical protein
MIPALMMKSLSRKGFSFVFESRPVSNTMN